MYIVQWPMTVKKRWSYLFPSYTLEWRVLIIYIQRDSSSRLIRKNYPSNFLEYNYGESFLTRVLKLEWVSFHHDSFNFGDVSWPQAKANISQRKSLDWLKKKKKANPKVLAEN